VLLTDAAATIMLMSARSWPR